MQRATLRLLIGIMVVLPLAAQQGVPLPDWKAFQFLIGDWVGEGSGSPGTGGGGFTFGLELQGHVLVRHNHTEFPASQGRPAYIHDDLLVVYQEKDGFKAVYWDNEGHVIHYTVSFAPDKSLVFVSGKMAGAPRQRLSYRDLGNGGLGIRFEIAPPDKPDDFKVYLDGAARKK